MAISDVKMKIFRGALLWSTDNWTTPPFGEPANYFLQIKPDLVNDGGDKAIIFIREKGISDAVKSLPQGLYVWYENITELDGTPVVFTSQEDAIEQITPILFNINPDIAQVTIIGQPIGVYVTSSALPTGAATLAEQQAQTTKLTSLDGKDFATSTKQTSLENLLTRSSLYARRSGATSAAVKSGAGILKRIVLGDNKGSSITLYDSLSATGTVITIINPIQSGALEYDVPFTVGLFVVTVGVGIEATIIYQ